MTTVPGSAPARAPAPISTAPVVRGPHGVAIGLFLLVWLSCIWFGSNDYNPNNLTRLFAAISLVEDHDATIDEFETMTVDKAQFDGHFYMDKTPGMTLMTLPAIWLADTLIGDRASSHPIDLDNGDFARFLRLRMQLAVAMIAVLVALASVLLLDLATGITGSARAGLIAALAYAMGTPIWGWATTLFGHAAVSALLIIATWAAWRGTSSARDLARPRYPILLGLALGWALVVELPAVLPGTVIGLWAIWRVRRLPMTDRVRLGAITAAAGIVALLPLFAYNQIAFGTWFRVGYQGVVGFEGMNQGLFGLTYPHPDIVLAILFGARRGLLFVAPLLFLAPLGLARLIRAPATRDLGIMAGALVITVLLYNASYYYWHGGYSTGPRHAMPAMAFLALGIAPLWRQWDGKGRALILLLLAGTMFINLAITAAEITASDLDPFPLVHPVMSKFAALHIRTLPSDWWGWSTSRGLMLYLVLALPALWFLWRAAGLSEAATARSLAVVA